jgi:KipI family sensor histidine kinase inhibitor
VIRALTAGDAAVLLEPDRVRPAALAAAITQAAPPGVLDAIPGAMTVLVTFEPGAMTAGELARRASALAAGDPGLTAPPPPVEIEVCYDGPDLADVAALTGLSVADVIERHQAGRYEVGWLGFSPGFGYLTGLDPALAAVPRLDTPRLSVPAGSVAIAGGLAAVYPATSPGGWRILGRTTVRLWDQERAPPAVLAPGTPVRFRAVSRLTPSPEPAPAPARPVATGGRAVEILQPGPQTTVQDLGRAGLGCLGVPVSGAADAVSLRAANALVGNEPGQAGLEVTLGRLALRFDAPAMAALTGAPAPLRITTPDGARLEPAPGTAFEVTAGTVLRLGGPAAGLRSYLAVDGGFDLPPVLGSRSADLLSGLGPPPLGPGQRLPLGPPPPGPRPPDTRLPEQTRLPVAGTITGLQVRLGPRADWFTPAAVTALTEATWQVTPASDRTGLRLSGPKLARASTAELPSEGVATGSLQISHDGQPILLLADHPVTGGYPVIAVVRAIDIGTAAQLRPGQSVRFVAT